MSFFSGLLSKLGAVTKEDLSKIRSKGEIYEIEDYTKSYRQRSEGILTFDQMYQYYYTNTWIRACVDKIVGAAVKIKPVVVPTDESKELSEETKEHIKKVEELLENPNSREESFETLRRKILKDLLIYDSAALEVVYTEGGEPWELYDLPGANIRLNVDKFGNFKDEDNAYCLIPKARFGSGKDPVWFKLNEVIYLLANPRAGSVYGLSPLESLVNAIKADLKAEYYNASFFDNNAEAAGIVGLEGIDSRSLKRFIAKWKQAHKGQGKAHKTAFTDAKVSFARMSETARDMQFMEYQRWLLQKIITVYQIPPFVLGVIDSSTGKLNSTEQYNLFKEQALDPLLSLEKYFYTTKLIKAGFGFNDIKLEFESTDIKDEEKEAKIIDILVKPGIITINEARKMYLGLDEVDWGNRPYIPTKPILLTESSVEEKPQEAEEKQVKSESTGNFKQTLDQIKDRIKDIILERADDI